MEVKTSSLHLTNYLLIIGNPSQGHLNSPRELDHMSTSSYGNKRIYHRVPSANPADVTSCRMMSFFVLFFFPAGIA
jgi:hypothetical protein